MPCVAGYILVCLEAVGIATSYDVVQYNVTQSDLIMYDMVQDDLIYIYSIPVAKV